MPELRVLYNTLNQLSTTNNFNNKKNFLLEKIHLDKINTVDIIHGKYVILISNKEFLIKKGEILFKYSPKFIYHNPFDKISKIKMKQIIHKNNLFLKELTYQNMVTHFKYSVDIFINGVKKDNNTLRFIFDTSCNLYIKSFHSQTINEDIILVEKKVKRYIRFTNTLSFNPIEKINNLLVFRNGRITQSFTLNGSILTISGTVGDLIEIIELDNDISNMDISQNIEYIRIPNLTYEIDNSSILVFNTNGEILNCNTKDCSKNILKINSHLNINKRIYYVNNIITNHNPKNDIEKYCNIFGCDSLLNGLNSNNIPQFIYDNINTLPINIDHTEEYYRNENTPGSLILTDNEGYITYKEDCLKSWIGYNSEFYDTYLKNLKINNDIESINFTTNIYLNKKVIYKSNFSDGDTTGWQNYLLGGSVLSWINNIRYFKRITNGNPNGSFRILNENIINYFLTFSFTIQSPTEPLIFGLTDSNFNGYSIEINTQLGNEYICLKRNNNGISSYIGDISPTKNINLNFINNKIYTVKIIKNFNNFELYLYDSHIDEETTFSLKENKLYKINDNQFSDTIFDRILIQGGIDYFFRDIVLRNSNITDESSSPRTSLLIENVPYNLKIGNIKHQITNPSYCFLVQTDKDITNNYISLSIDGIKIPYTNRNILMNYHKKIGNYNYFIILVGQGTLVLKGNEQSKIEFIPINDINFSLAISFNNTINNNFFKSYMSKEDFLFFKEENGKTNSLNPSDFNVTILDNSIYIETTNSSLLSKNIIIAYKHRTHIYEYIHSEADTNLLYLTLNNFKYFDKDLDRYKIYKNGRYIPKEYFELVEPDIDNDFNSLTILFKFHIEDSDIITIEYLTNKHKEIYREAILDTTGIVYITEPTRFPVTTDYYRFYINGRELNPYQIYPISNTNFMVQNIKSRHELAVVEKHIELDEFSNAYNISDKSFNLYIQTFLKENLFTILNGEYTITDEELNNIEYSINILKVMFAQLYDEHLKRIVVDSSVQIASNILEEYYVLQNNQGYIVINMEQGQIKMMPLDPAIDDPTVPGSLFGY